MYGPQPEVRPQDYKRLRRFEIAGDARALNFSCFQNLPFLRRERACEWLADAIRTHVPKFKCDLWAYCFMPTHVHLLLFPRGEPDIASLSSAIKKSVAVKAVRWVKQNAPEFLRHMRDAQPDGTFIHRFWQRGGGFDRNIREHHDSKRSVWDMIDYIHDNPVAAKLATRPEEWRWSSAAWYAVPGTGALQLQLDKLPRRRV